MNVKVKLEHLRADYGEGAVKAYHAIGALLFEKKEVMAVMVELHNLFERYGIEATGAALRLHAQQTREMIDLIRLGQRKESPKRTPARRSHLRIVRSKSDT